MATTMAEQKKSGCVTAQTVTSLSSWRFSVMPVYVGFVVVKVALGQIFF
jgi:hypothetical protein